ncbi:Phospholipid-binding_copine family protein [Hexamita inflata]|uniref:Phospholipid-binding copine family protein n=1 Tax=Hexamita inflata TaxID=28002 RepID=A0AA86R6A4_9EUKA|nr:Phospholipid-binding copine family protein [Hexamita inflata]
MGGDKSEVLLKEQFVDLQQKFSLLDDLHFVIAVDASYSNKKRAVKSGWGTSLHAPGIIQTNLGQLTVQSEYRRAIELLSYKIGKEFLFDIHGKQIQELDMLFYSDGVKVKKSVTYDQILPTYDKYAQLFNQEAPEFFQQSGSDISSVIYDCIESSVLSGQFVVLILLTDGDLFDCGEARQAVVDASYFPMSIAALGIGNGPFDSIQVFDNKIYDRMFDNFCFHHFDYVRVNSEKNYLEPGEMCNLRTCSVKNGQNFYKTLQGECPQDDQKAEQTLLLGIFNEIVGQYQYAGQAYREVASLIKKRTKEEM